MEMAANHQSEILQEFRLVLGDADFLAKLVPNNTKLSDIFNSDKKKLSSDLRSDDYSNAIELKSLADGDDLQAETINQARVIEEV